MAPSTRSISSCWASEPKTRRRLSAFWWWSVWPHGTRSWTPGSTSCWGKQFWEKSSCCCTDARVQSLITCTAGNAVCSAARPKQTSQLLACLTVAALVNFLSQTLLSNPSLESTVFIVHEVNRKQLEFITRCSFCFFPCFLWSCEIIT